MVQLALTLLVLTVYQQARIAGSVLLDEDVAPFDQGNCNILCVVYFIAYIFVYLYNATLLLCCIALVVSVLVGFVL